MAVPSLPRSAPPAAPPTAVSRSRRPVVPLPVFRRLAIVAAVVLGLIVVTGGAVRLTGSGLGCPTWPRCTAHSLVAPASYHALVEFVNRVISALVGVVVVAVAVASLLVDRRRRDLAPYAWGLVAGVAGQAVLGGLTVLYKLSPPWVMAHFLLSMVVLWDALVLVHRTAAPAAVPAVRSEVRRLTGGLTAVAALVLVLGTVTTGTGPHAGSRDTPRLHLPLERVTQLHADSALLLTGLILATLVALRLAEVPAGMRRLGRWLGAVVLVQVAIGYTQYFLDLPPGLIILHIAGATALWSVTVLLWLQARSARAATEAAG